MREQWWIAPELAPQLEALCPLDVAAWSAKAAAATWLSSDRQSAAALVPGRAPLLVKWRHTLARRRRKTIGRASKERREARAYLALAERGVKAPVPWAVGERRVGGALVGSVLIRPFHEDCRDARAAAGEDASILEALGRDLRGWHDLGFRHGDCYPKNVLVFQSGAAPVPMGCPAARFVKPGPGVDRRRRKDLAQWAAGVVEIDASRAPLGFLRTYAEAPGLDAEGLEAEIAPHFEKILRQKERREESRPAREPSGPPKPVVLRGSPSRVRRAPLATLRRGEPR